MGLVQSINAMVYLYNVFNFYNVNLLLQQLAVTNTENCVVMYQPRLVLTKVASQEPRSNDCIFRSPLFLKFKKVYPSPRPHDTYGDSMFLSLSTTSFPPKAYAKQSQRSQIPSSKFSDKETAALRSACGTEKSGF